MAGPSFKRAKSTLVLMLLAAEAISVAPLELHLSISGEQGQENIQLHLYKGTSTMATENTSGISGPSPITNGDKFSPDSKYDFQSPHTPQQNPQINPIGLYNSPFSNGNGFSTPGSSIFSNPQGPAQGQYPVGAPPQVARPGAGGFPGGTDVPKEGSFGYSTEEEGEEEDDYEEDNESLTQGQYPEGPPLQVTRPGFISGRPVVGGYPGSPGGPGGPVESGFFIDGRKKLKQGRRK